MKKLYNVTRTLSGKNSNPSRPVKDKNGNLLSNEGGQRARWAESFKKTLNRPAPQTPPTIPPPTELLGINTNPPSRIEISRAIKSLKTGKAAGPDGIPPEALKADTQTSTEMLYPLLNKVWEQEQVPEDWKKGHDYGETAKEMRYFVLQQLERYHAAVNSWQNVDQHYLGTTKDSPRQETTGLAGRFSPRQIMH